MLEAVPTGWFSWDFTIQHDGRPIALIDRSWIRERGTFDLEGRRYDIYRESLFTGSFVLEHGGRVVARAHKPHLRRQYFEIWGPNRQFQLRAAAVLSRRFTLFHGDRAIGSVRPRGSFSRRAVVDLPEDIPLPVRLFIVFLVVLLWKRAALAAGGA